MQKRVLKTLSLLVIGVMLICAMPVSGFSAEEEVVGTWKTLVSTNVDDFTKTSNTLQVNQKGNFASNKSIDGTTVNLKVVASGAALNGGWYAGNYCNIISSADYANGAPAIMGDKVLFADLNWTTWPGNLVHPNSGPTIDPIFAGKEVKPGDRMKITAWVYATEVYSGWAADSTRLEDQTTPFNIKMWANRPWKSNSDKGYNNLGDIANVTLNQQARANQWTELVLEYTVTEANKSINQLNISVDQGDTSKPYPRNLFLAGYKVEKFVETKGSYSIDLESKDVVGNVTFAIANENALEDPKLLIAAYKDSLLLGVDIIDYDSEKTSYPFTIAKASEADNIRAYLWEYKKAAPVMENPIELKFDKFIYETKFSILGDSYSTFAGYLHPENSAPYYPDDAASRGNDVSKVEQTWWYLFEQEYKVSLDKNNSYSGSTVCYDGYGGGTADAKNISFVSRITDIGNPDILIIEGGTNDDWANAGYGEFKYDNFTEKDFETYRPALAYILKTAKENNPDCRIIFMMNNGLDGTIASSTRTICEYYDVELLALSGIDKQDGHPSIKGMVQIKDQLIALMNSK